MNEESMKVTKLLEGIVGADTNYYAAVLANLGVVYNKMKRYQDAEDYLTES